MPTLTLCWARRISCVAALLAPFFHAPDVAAYQPGFLRSTSPYSSDPTREFVMQRSFRELAMALGCAGAIACGEDVAGPDDRFVAAAEVAPDSLGPNRDTYLAASDPNKPRGTRDSMVIEPANKNRVLVAFDQATIATRVGNSALSTATLELTIKAANAAWGAGGTVELYRLTKDWTEAGATWNCAVDANTGNSTPDCSGSTAWSMGGTPLPWASPRTAQFTVTNGMSGVVRLDVTSDVRSFLAGTSNVGWLIKALTEGAGVTGRLSFWSREATVAARRPRLILTLSPPGVRPPVPTTTTWPSPALTVVLPSDPAAHYFRDVFAVQFDDSTGTQGVNNFLSAFQATIVGGVVAGSPLEEYYVRVPDPGAAYRVVDSVAQAMWAFPGVKLARMVGGGTLRLRGRYPVDAAHTIRSRWFGAPTAGTLPWIAVRAPLAWGCEMGGYGGPRIRVGVADAFFDGQHADLPSTTTIHYAQPTDLDPATSVDDATANHGTAVAGVAAAVGDNGIGTAGMMWDVDLDLYPFGRDGQSHRDDVARFKEILEAAVAQDVKVLNLSAGVGNVANTASVTALEHAIAQFIGANSSRLLVIATGQQVGGTGLDLTLAQLSATTDTNLNASDRAAANLHRTNAAARNGLLFATGTDAENTRSSEANSWTDADQIGAPYEVVTLSYTTNQQSTREGTSFSAPFATGLAAQLWTMQPNLTATQVKQYILDGARVARIGAVGISVPALHITNGPVGTFQLDAYGSLNLLSKEQPLTPICGLDVTLEANADLMPGRLKIGRNTPEYINLNPASPANTYWGTYSVAKGGRLVAIDSLGSTTDVATLRRLQPSGWSPAGTVPNVTRLVYTERDTVYLRNVTTTTGSGLGAIIRRDLFVRVGSDVASRIVPEFKVTGGLSDAGFGAGWYSGGMPVSPDGDWLFMRWAYSGSEMYCTGPGDTSQDGMGTSYVWPLRSQQSGPTTLQSRPVHIWCGSPGPLPPPSPYEGDEASFRPDGDQFFLVTHMTPTGSGTGNVADRFQRYDLAPDAIAPVGATTLVDRMRSTWISWAPEGSYFRLQEMPNYPSATNCTLTRRAVDALGQTFGTTTTIANCFDTKISVAPSIARKD